MLIQVTITPAEGKRLIGRAVASMDIVQHALKDGTIVIATSTSSSFVLEELLGMKVPGFGILLFLLELLFYVQVFFFHILKFRHFHKVIIAFPIPAHRPAVLPVLGQEEGFQVGMALNIDTK